MARLYLFAEGSTEQTFANTVLKPHLANFGVYMHNPVLIAHARKKGRIHRGGGRNFTAMQNDIAAIWDYKLGGYQVLKKWLSYREHKVLDRALSPEEVQYFADTARRIGAILLMTARDIS